MTKTKPNTIVIVWYGMWSISFKFSMDDCSKESIPEIHI